MTARDEQETTVTFMRDDPLVYVSTSNLPHVRRLRKLACTGDFVTEVRGGDDWGEFTVKAEFFHLFSAIRRKRRLSEEARVAAVARLEAARAMT